jgi:hypothetical protein
MAKSPDDTLLLVLSKKEASMLHNITKAPEETVTIGKARIIQIAIAVLLLTGCAILGLAHPELARALVESVMLLVL